MQYMQKYVKADTYSIYIVLLLFTVATGLQTFTDLPVGLVVQQLRVIQWYQYGPETQF